MTVSGCSALISSFAGLRGLAVAAGWGSSMAALLPLTVDAYALAATRVWLAASVAGTRLYRFARWNALVAICLSLAGNATDHALSARLLHMSWSVVVLVGAVPPVVLGLVAHLAALRQQDELSTASPGPSPILTPETGTPRRSEAELLAAARAADAAHRAAHGKSITRDALRRELRVSGARATEILRRVRAERASNMNGAQ